MCYSVGIQQDCDCVTAWVVVTKHVTHLGLSHKVDSGEVEGVIEMDEQLAEG